MIKNLTAEDLRNLPLKRLNSMLLCKDFKFVRGNAILFEGTCEEVDKKSDCLWFFNNKLCYDVNFCYDFEEGFVPFDFDYFDYVEAIEKED